MSKDRSLGESGSWGKDLNSWDDDGDLDSLSRGCGSPELVVEGDESVIEVELWLVPTFVDSGFFKWGRSFLNWLFSSSCDRCSLVLSLLLSGLRCRLFRLSLFDWSSLWGFLPCHIDRHWGGSQGSRSWLSSVLLRLDSEDGSFSSVSILSLELSQELLSPPRKRKCADKQNNQN